MVDEYVLSEDARARGRVANTQWRDRHQPDRKVRQNDRTIEPTVLDVAYTAGFLDGEGYLGTLRKPEAKYVTGRVAVSGIVVTPLEYLRAWWGGTVGSHAAYQPNRRPASNWVLSDKAMVERLLIAVRPMLTVKQTQADLLLELVRLPKLIRSQPNTELIARRLAIHNELRRLNRRGAAEEVI